MPGNLSQYELRLDSLFRGRYLRNNKRGGLKHLRCFPECLSTGHHASGFCGHRVVVSTFSAEPLPNGALVVAKFSLADDPLCDLTLGGTVGKDTVVGQVRSREQPTADFVQATKVKQEDTSDGRVRTVFHMEQPSWHYGWRSSKHTKDRKHRMYVYLLLPKGGAGLVCAAHGESTEFKLSSSKRARDGQEPKHQHLCVTSDEIAASLLEAQARSLKKRKRYQKPNKQPKAKVAKKAGRADAAKEEEEEQATGEDSIMLLLPSDSEHEDNDDDFMELVYPDTGPIAHSRPGEEEEDDLKPLQAHHEDILLEFLGWPKSLQDLTQDDGNGFKFNEPNAGTDFIDPAFFFG